MHRVMLAVVSGALAIGSLDAFERSVVSNRMKPRRGWSAGPRDREVHGAAAYIPSASRRRKAKIKAAHRARTARGASGLVGKHDPTIGFWARGES